jgi:hypothetical protein
MKTIIEEFATSDIEDYVIVLNDETVPQNAPTRTYNAPTNIEVAALMCSDLDGNREGYKRSLIVYPRSGGLREVKSWHSTYLPLGYTLFYMRGEQGWHFNLLSSQNKSVTLQDYCSYILSARDQDDLKKDTLLCGSGLTQQFICDLYVSIESQRLDWVRQNQRQLKADTYKGLADAVSMNEGAQAGTYVVLPSTHVGGPRWYYQQYQDAMARVRTYGKPSLFITKYYDHRRKKLSQVPKKKSCSRRE